MGTLKKDSSGRIIAASADDLVEMLAPKKSMYEEDMARMTKGVLPNRPLPSNYPVGKTDASGMTLMPSGNWRDASGKETMYHKPTINSAPKEEVEEKKKGGAIKSSASNRADGCCKRGHTKGKYL